MGLVLAGPTSRDELLHDGEVPVVMLKHDRLKVGEVAIRWIGDEDGFVHVTSTSPTACSIAKGPA
ncbi:MAG: hypothetical protein KC656_06455 [Myxococcales bacterium]|nr:hypothetical protein [Myxococcales bacterium]